MMRDPQEARRRHVAYDEAAHAVIAATLGCTVSRLDLITLGATVDGSCIWNENSPGTFTNPFKQKHPIQLVSNIIADESLCRELANLHNPLGVVVTLAGELGQTVAEPDELAILSEIDTQLLNTVSLPPHVWERLKNYVRAALVARQPALDALATELLSRDHLEQDRIAEILVACGVKPELI